MDPTIDAARRHPEIVFMHCSGYKTAPNVGTYFGRMYQARYLSGIVAGATTTTNKLGYVAALPTPDVIHGINAFALGAQSVNPEVEVQVLWTDSWYDPPVERRQAETLLDQGAAQLIRDASAEAAARLRDPRARPN
jgi:basic membrane protein A